MPNFESYCCCPGCGTCDGHRAARRTREHLKAEIAKIDADPRSKPPWAKVFSNAPLALIQIELKTRRAALQEALTQLGG